MSESAGTPVSARAWCRVDLAGGTLDLWPLGLLHPGSRTVNLAIDVAVSVTLRPRAEGFRVRQGDDEAIADSVTELKALPGAALAGLVFEALEVPGAEVEIESGSPRGGGLGASSALAVALITAGDRLRAGRRRLPAETVAIARDLEAALMELPTGIQDHYPALLGGALEITFRPGSHRARKLAVDLEALGRCLVVAYSGQSHFSAGNNWQIIRRRLEGDREVVERFAAISRVAEELAPALEAGDLPRVGELMSAEWAQRRGLADGISTPTLEALLEAAGAAGAWGGKACGAGGGGCLAVLAPEERRRAVMAALEAAGATLLPAAPAGEPLILKDLSSAT
ncbi:MAG: hypothetical protein AAF604_01320 [Acidobacteriota bacterium]